MMSLGRTGQELSQAGRRNRVRPAAVMVTGVAAVKGTAEIELLNE